MLLSNITFLIFGALVKCNVVRKCHFKLLFFLQLYLLFFYFPLGIVYLFFVSTGDIQYVCKILHATFARSRDRRWLRILKVGHMTMTTAPRGPVCHLLASIAMIQVYPFQR